MLTTEHLIFYLILIDVSHPRGKINSYERPRRGHRRTRGPDVRSKPRPLLAHAFPAALNPRHAAVRYVDHAVETAVERICQIAYVGSNSII